MHFLWWIIVGLIAGWATGKIMRGSGYGAFVDILIGIAGAIVGGWIMRAIGFQGQGGIQTWQDAVEFLLAGSSAVAIGTALFVDPATPNKICDGLAEYMRETKTCRVSDLVGALEMPGDQPATTPYP